MTSKRVLTYCSNCAEVTDSINPIYNNNMVTSICKKCKKEKQSTHMGYGLINNLISSPHMPEIHLIDQADDGKIKRANFVGPWTKLDKRLKNFNEAEGTYDDIITQPINDLDKAALQHDLVYSKYKDLDNRIIADKELYDAAMSIFNNPDSTSIQKLNALLVSTVMHSKVKFGYGVEGGMMNFNPVVMGNEEIVKALIGLLITATPFVGKKLYDKFIK